MNHTTSSRVKGPEPSGGSDKRRQTFIGEGAAIKAIAEGRKVVFLLPYKALVNEKFEDFSALYSEKLSLRVARCSGDYQDQVAAWHVRRTARSSSVTMFPVHPIYRAILPVV